MYTALVKPPQDESCGGKLVIILTHVNIDNQIVAVVAK